MRKLIFVNRFYSPDNSATSQILTELAEHLAENGENVSVIASRLRYENQDERLCSEETINLVKVYRIWTTGFGRYSTLGRILDYLSFYISCFIQLLIQTNYETIVITKTDPPMISVIGAVVIKFRGGKLITWNQDLFPEIAFALSKSQKTHLISKIILKIRNFSLKSANKNVAIGLEMAKIIEESGSPKDKIEVIPNWVVGKTYDPVKKEDNGLTAKWNLKNKFIVGYSGNLGKAHDYQTILSVIESFRNDSEMIFLFIGSGAGMNILKAKTAEFGLNNVVYKPYQPLEFLSHSLSVPDIHIVTLQPELEGLVVPSKFYGVISVHKPIMYIGSKTGEIGKIVTENACGAVFESTRTDEICNWIIQVRNDNQYRKSLEDASERLFKVKYNKTESLNHWRKAINEI